MWLPWGTAFLALWGATLSVNFHVDLNMAGIQGNIKLDSILQTALINLTSICENVTITLREFPVMYGNFLEPCEPLQTGNQLYQFTFNKPLQSNATFKVSGLFLANRGLAGLSLVVKTCSRQACGNVRKPGSTIRTWQAKFYSFIVGEAYFRQEGDEASLTVMTDFVVARAGESVPLNVSLYLSPTCNSSERKMNVSLGTYKVGIQPQAMKLGIWVANATVTPFALLGYKDQWLCAEVKPVGAKSVNALINMNGVRGGFNFTQVSPFDPTEILVSFENVTGLEKYFHVHKFPVPQRKDPQENLCDRSSTGDHWNPFNANVTAASYPKAPGATHDLYEVGDLSGRHGPLDGMNAFASMITDWNLPLFGRNSIVGRSIVIHKADNSRFSCGTIGYEGDMITAVAVFRKTVVGRIIFRQLKSNQYSDMSIYLDLSYSNASALPTANHKWHVHEFPISTETDTDSEACSSTKGGFIPAGMEAGVNNSERCQPLNPFLCEVSDCSGRHKALNLSNLVRSADSKAFFTDTILPLSGPGSILGKSLMIHGAAQTWTRVACANITFLRPSLGKTGQWFGSKQVEGAFSVSQNLDVDPTGISVSFTNLGSLCGGYHVHKLPIMPNSSDPCSDPLIRGHFNPFLVNVTLSPAPGTGTVDKYEVGDISGKYGTLANKDTFSQQRLDSNLPLSESYSILGRSLVIHYSNGSRLQCANIEPQKAPDGEWVRAKVEFNGSVSGSILMVQQVFPDGSYSDTTIEVNLKSSETQGTELEWYILNRFLQKEDGQCPQAADAEAYNPHDIYQGPGYSSSCSQGYPLHCAVGDMAGKHGRVTAGTRQLVTDANLPLAGDLTVVGRGLVLKRGLDVLDCALIGLEGPIVTTLVFPMMTAFSRYEFRSAVAIVLTEPLWKVNILPEGPIEMVLGKCLKISFFVIATCSNGQDAVPLMLLQERKPLHSRYRHFP
ncbi:uncharacterized protein [Ambystoma mexicanum]|uniref:uncharacterized protein isoform X2 n=1 Tax=Ambystoma mexicanum TaxID=8296 RepID=UPI0037E86095